jgi:hypothetical protein
MHSFKRPALRAAFLMLASAAIAAAQPALTTVQDTLYRADGTRFTGTIFITWNSFVSGSGANVATSNLTLPIVNGVLKVALVPTTTATAGAQYNVRYNSRGIDQFTEVWAVPPSTVSLRVRDVRVSQGVVVGPPPVISPVQIPDVVGLANELSLRPQKGVGFALGRAAVINQSGQLDAASGRPTDCVRVDGSAGACGGSSSGNTALPGYADAETPSGAINGANLVFTLQFPPSPAASLALYKNGLLERAGIDYVLSQNTITFFQSTVPNTGDVLSAYYRYGSSGNPAGSLAPAQVVCSSAGTAVAAAVSTQLGSCTIPAGLLTTGDRLDIRFLYSHTGTTTGFTGEVRVGSTSVFLRSAGASEPLLTGRVNVAVGTANQQWDSQNWGTGLSFAAGAGVSSEDTTQNLTIDFRGQTATTAADILTLSNFTVIRYPAQANP